MFSIYKLTEFGNALRQIRVNARLTQFDVHLLTGLNEDTLRKIENGKSIPKYETLEILTSIYKLDLLELLKTHRKSTYISDFYNNLDRIIMVNDSDLINSLNNNMDQLRAASSDLILIHPILGYQQTQLYTLGYHNPQW
ncbi:MAG: helix-turn-helix domain-containing protein [Alkaliphilus sp.]